MRRFTRLTLAVLAVLMGIPAAAFAQASIVGVVKDTSGAVLPGVTVEAASPALIEKTRSVATDGTGQYRIVDLRPGTYSVTFTLSGFNTVRREGLEVTGSFVATINAELKVGAVAETITVTGETPIVDVQSAQKERVLNHEVIDAIPQGRFTAALGVLVPGISLASGTQDVGGAAGNALAATLGAHGSKQDSQRLLQNGISLASMAVTGYGSSTSPNLGAMQEVTLDYAAVSAEQSTGGVNINMIPRDGGNTFKGAVFASFANSSMQGNNLTQDLITRGLATPDSIKKNWDINPGFGGPIKKDKLWFYESIRYNGAYNYVAGIYNNLNANNPNAWVYAPDLSSRPSNDSTWKDQQIRLTWQASPKNKIGFSWNQENNCLCLSTIAATQAPEAARYWYFPLQRQLYADWASPITNRILLEAVATQRLERYIMDRPRDLSALMVNVLDQSNGLSYRARDFYANTLADPFYYRVALSYVTGAHAFKAGLGDAWGGNNAGNYDNQPYSIRVNTVAGVPVPNQITERAFPYSAVNQVDHDLGIYAQDRWTSKRLTATLGFRFDSFNSSFPQQHLGPAPLTPVRNITFPAANNLSLKDITPKLGLTYDVFGTGKTAFRASLNKYVVGLGTTGGISSGPNPAATIITSTTRSWTDRNGNYIPDCDLLNPAAQTVTNGDICGGLANVNFGNAVPGAVYDPAILTGWGHRGYNWEFSTGVQHEIVPRVSVDIAYFRRWYGNFFITDNLAVASSDYTAFSVTAPADSRLAGGGGYVVSGLYDLNPAKFGVPAQNYNTFADNYGEQIEHWNFIDGTVSTRPRAGMLLQGGFSTGRQVTDNCAAVASLPEALVVAAVSQPQSFCHVQTPFLTQIKFLGSYTIPKIDTQVSGALQSLPGPLIAANFVAANALVQPSLGRPLSGGAANTTVNLVAPGSLYGERLNQLDLRIGKIIKYGRTRSVVSLDIYNALNESTVLTLNNSFAVWQRPISILVARFAKVAVQFDF